MYKCIEIFIFGVGKVEYEAVDDFKQFVEFQNENAVAESMNITQPTVTFHLKNLNKTMAFLCIIKR